MARASSGVVGAVAVGVPVKLLHEAEGHVVSVELLTGETYRGHLAAAENTMNISLTSVVHTARDGRVTRLENVYLRGSHVRFVVLPEILKHAPLFKKVADFAAAKAKPLNTGRGRGRGKPAAPAAAASAAGPR